MVVIYLLVWLELYRKCEAGITGGAQFYILSLSMLLLKYLLPELTNYIAKFFLLLGACIHGCLATYN